MLKEHIEILQKQMLLRLGEIRAAYRHSGNKGANAEQVLRDFLRQFLPPYNRVGHGEVIDQSGASSRQLDAIITNEYHPFLNDLSAPSVFIIEGVSCVAEVKSVLTSDQLIRALENSLSFKRLSVTLQKGATVFGNREDISRFVEKRPSFLFAFESQLSIGTIKEENRGLESGPAITNPSADGCGFRANWRQHNKLWDWRRIVTIYYTRLEVSIWLRLHRSQRGSSAHFSTFVD
jgi:hypothetical protein